MIIGWDFVELKKHLRLYSNVSKVGGLQSQGVKGVFNPDQTEQI
jgi:hypothetical protein